MLMKNFLQSKDYWQVIEYEVAESTAEEALSENSLPVHEKKINHHEQEEKVLTTSTIDSRSMSH